MARRVRRFPPAFGGELSAYYQTTFGLTPEAADIVAAVQQADNADLASVGLFLNAYADASSEPGLVGSASDDAIKARMRVLRRDRTLRAFPDFWSAVAGESVRREERTDDR
jgi:hypothetical protein